MGQREILLQISKSLAKHKISYLLTGSFAVSYYGYPRATHDIDFVLEVDIKEYPRLEKSLGELDNKLFLIDWNDVKKGIKKYSQFNILDLDSGIKIDFWPVKKNEFELSKFKRKKRTILFKKKVHIISAEDLILNKLLWCKKIRSEKHIRDCTGIWKIQAGKLDIKYLKFWSKRLGVMKLLKEISKINV